MENSSTIINDLETKNDEFSYVFASFNESELNTSQADVGETKVKKLIQSSPRWHDDVRMSPKICLLSVSIIWCALRQWRWLTPIRKSVDRRFENIVPPEQWSSICFFVRSDRCRKPRLQARLDVIFIGEEHILFSLQQSADLALPITWVNRARVEKRPAR